MPRGKYVNHKGKNRHFTSPDELEEEMKNDAMKKKWRQKDDEESESEEEAEGGSDEEEDSDEEEGEHKAKGVQGLIEIENPNRVQKKAAQKVTKVSASSSTGPELSRREREEVEKQKAQAHYQKLHAEGKTEQAKADLARLAIIRQQREEAAKRRMEEEKKKEIKK